MTKKSNHIVEDSQMLNLTMMYRILNGLVEIPPAVYLHPATVTTRGNSAKFILPWCGTTYRKQAFFPSTIRLKNALPEHLASMPSLEAFKQGLAPGH